MLNYDYREGSKGTLIFVHGAGGTRHKWRKLMAGLPEGYGGLALDLPGHGESGGEAMDSVEGYARAIIDGLQQAAPVRPLIWAGHSLGGAIVQTAALIAPDMVDGLVLLGTGGRLKVLPALLDNLQKGIFDADNLRLAYSPATPEDLVRAELEQDAKTPAAVVYKDFLACDSFDILDRLENICQPTQLIVGDDDVFTPVKYSEALLKKLPQARMTIIAQAGHTAALEQPEAIIDCIKEFLDSLG